MPKEELEAITCSVETIASDVQDEKEMILSYMIDIQLRMQIVFADNPNLINALNYMNNCFKVILDESNSEHIVMEKMLDLLTDKNIKFSKEQGKELTSILETFENLCDTRFYNTVTLHSFYCDLIESGILTNMNYYVKSLKERVSVEETNEMLLKLGAMR